MLRKARIGSEADAQRLMAAFRRIPRRPDYGYRESSEPADLLKLMRGAERVPHPPERELLERLQGAWTGRAAGCMLGKPVEMWTAAKIKAASGLSRTMRITAAIMVRSV